MSLSIIIVNYKCPQLILDCLESIGRSEISHGFELIVVDNASGDDSRERILSVFPEVLWIQMDYNSGFARANNEGIRRCSGDVVLLLNADTLPGAPTIGACYHRLLASPFIGAGVQLLNADGSPQISGMYVMKGGLNYLLPLPYLGAVIKAAGEMAGVKKPHVHDVQAASSPAVEVDWINGAFLMVKRTAIDAAGLMDEDFFLYAEEAEWCSRLKKAGPLCIYGDLRVIHLQGETTSREFGSAGKGYNNLFDRKGLQILLSTFVRIRKQFGVGWFLVQLVFYVLEVPVFFFGWAFSSAFEGSKARYSFSQFTGYLRNIAYVIGKSSYILRNKPYFYKVL